MIVSIRTHFGTTTLLCITFVLLHMNLSFAQKATPSSALDQQPYLSSCQNSDKELQKECSQKSLLTFVSENVSYPEAAYAAQAEGMVLLEFVVGKNGQVLSGKVAKSSKHSSLDQAALAVLEALKNSPQKWTSGHKDGKDVDTIMTLPVKFKLK